jgi:hypothetical protein
MIQSSNKILKEIVGGSFGAENLNNFFQIRRRFRMTTFCVYITPEYYD